MRRGVMRLFAAVLRTWRRVRDFAFEAAGILGCLLLIALFLPLVPVFQMFEDIGDAMRNE